MESVENESQDERVQRLQQKLDELREQRIKVDKANELLQERIQKLSSHMQSLNEKYSKEDTTDQPADENSSSQ